jgi:hypothetical protein
MKRYSLGLLTALALTACPTVGQTAPTGTISGTVTVPIGVDVKDTIVIACFLVGMDSCDDKKTGGAVIAQSGSSAAYTIPDLTPGDYVVLAVKVTLDANREIKSIDYLGGYGSDSTRVKPPASHIDIALKATATNTPTAPPSTTPAPAGKVSAEVVGSWISQASGTDIYTINTDGTYSRNLRDSYPCYLIQRSPGAAVPRRIGASCRVPRSRTALKPIRSTPTATCS